MDNIDYIYPQERYHHSAICLMRWRVGAWAIIATVQRPVSVMDTTADANLIGSCASAAVPSNRVIGVIGRMKDRG